MTRFHRAFTDTELSFGMDCRAPSCGGPDFDSIKEELRRVYSLLEQAERVAELVVSDVCERERSPKAAKQFLEALERE